MSGQAVNPSKSYIIADTFVLDILFLDIIYAANTSRTSIQNSNCVRGPNELGIYSITLADRRSAVPRLIIKS